MSGNHWTTKLPYLVPNWESVAHDDRDIHVTVDPSGELDVGCVGVFKGINHKPIRKCDYVTKKTSLPFYVDRETYIPEKPVVNSLCYSEKHNLLVSAHQTSVRFFHLEFASRFVTDKFEFAQNVPHQYCTGKTFPNSPFLWNVKSVKTTETKHLINDMKWYESPTTDTIFTFSDYMFKILEYDSETDHLYNRRTFGKTSKLAKLSKGNSFDICDHNVDINTMLLTTFQNDNVIYLFDLITETKFSENQTLKLDKIVDNRDRLMDVHWSQNHNPFVYFFGSHRTLYMGDFRESESRVFAKPSDNQNLRSFETFHRLVQNPLEGNQVIVSTDTQVIFMDVRFPKKSIFQIRHMIRDQLVRKLVCRPIKIYGKDRLLLLMTNSDACAIATLDTQSCVQPIMQHSLMHVNVPKNSEVMFPKMPLRDTKITGMEAVPGKFQKDSNSNDFFTLFLHLNNCELFAQDFFIADEGYEHDANKSSFYRDCYEADSFDPDTAQYAALIDEYFAHALPVATPDQVEIEPVLTIGSPFHFIGYDQEVLVKEMALIDVAEEASRFPTISPDIKPEFTDNDRLDFDKLLETFESNQTLRTKLREVTCRISDHFIEAIHRAEEDSPARERAPVREDAEAQDDTEELPEVEDAVDVLSIL